MLTSPGKPATTTDGFGGGPGSAFFTGSSPFLRANRHFVQSLWRATGQCRIQSSEDIYDAQGVMLWAQHKPLSQALLEKLTDRLLRKPIELCVQAQDPVATAALEPSIDALCVRWPDFAAAVLPRRAAWSAVLHGLVPNPQELMLLSVLRHGQRDLLSHALAVTALALSAASALRLDAQWLPTLARAALLHDLGELYLSGDEAAQSYHERQQHPLLGALGAVELAQCSPAVAQLIASSHERLNGQGFPRGLGAAQLSMPQRILLFAEAMADLLVLPRRGALRAAMAARLVPHEFEPALVNWMAGVAHACAARGTVPPQAPSASPGPGIGLRLRHLHAELSRAVVLLSLPVGETPEVQLTARRWRDALEPLMAVLRSCGVEEALSLGQTLEPQGADEAAELEALQAELVQRVSEQARACDGQRAQSPALQASRLIRDLLRILQSAYTPPSTTDSE